MNEYLCISYVHHTPHPLLDGFFFHDNVSSAIDSCFSVVSGGNSSALLLYIGSKGVEGLWGWKLSITEC